MKCEWNPKTDMPTLINEESHAIASLLVGKFMLCEECAKQKRWKRFKKYSLTIVVADTASVLYSNVQGRCG